MDPEPGKTTAGDRTGDRTGDRLLDPVDEMVDESFPASDPPSGWAGEDPRDVDPAAAPDDTDDGARLAPPAGS